MAREPPVHVLLATYNGAPYLPAQLDSLRAQDDANWVLLVRDDGSQDDTPQILRQAARDDPRIRLLDTDGARLGSSANFFRLLQAAYDQGAQYFALADQDDLWQPQKLARMRAAIQALGQVHGSDRALLCWSDLSWIDRAGRTLARSHFRQAGAAAALAGPGTWLLAMNAVPGCAMLGNRALLERALPPPGVAHHDWWLALLAAVGGRVAVLPEPLVAYRQHAGNLIGAASPWRRLSEAVRAPQALLARARETYWQAVDNAVCLRQRVPRADLTQDWERALTHTVCELGASSAWRRCRAVLRGPVRRLGWRRNLLMLLAALGQARLPRGAAQRSVGDA